MKAMRSRSQRGAALVEMAVVLPLFVLMIFGMIEASWAFAQANDVRHGAREGARLAAVAAIPYQSVEDIGAEVCDRMDIAGGYEVIVTFGTNPPSSGPSNPIDDGSRGSEGQIEVSLSYTSITGALDQWFGGKTISSTIEFVIEAPISGASQWWTEAATPPASGTASHPC